MRKEHGAVSVAVGNAAVVSSCAGEGSLAGEVDRVDNSWLNGCASESTLSSSGGTYTTSVENHHPSLTVHRGHSAGSCDVASVVGQRRDVVTRLD